MNLFLRQHEVLLCAELVKYFLLCQQAQQAGGPPPPMVRCAVDAYWHAVIDREGYADPNLLPLGFYAQLSTDAVGAFMTFRHGEWERAGTGSIPWADDYHRRWGGMSCLWFVCGAGVPDVGALDQYLAGQQPDVTFDCFSESGFLGARPEDVYPPNVVRFPPARA